MALSFRWMMMSSSRAVWMMACVLCISTNPGNTVVRRSESHIMSSTTWRKFILYSTCSRLGDLGGVVHRDDYERRARREGRARPRAPARLRLRPLVALPVGDVDEELAVQGRLELLLPEDARRDFFFGGGALVGPAAAPMTRPPMRSTMACSLSFSSAAFWTASGMTRFSMACAALSNSAGVALFAVPSFEASFFVTPSSMGSDFSSAAAGGSRTTSFPTMSARQLLSKRTLSVCKRLVICSVASAIARLERARQDKAGAEILWEHLLRSGGRHHRIGKGTDGGL